MFKALALSATLFLASCYSSYPRPKNPWPGHLSAEMLYWCKSADGPWTPSEDLPVKCRAEDVSRGQWDLDLLPLSINSAPELMLETMEAVDAMNAALGFEMVAFDHSNYSPDITVIDFGRHPFAHAEAVRATHEGRDLGVILTYNGLHAKDRPDIILHELGHMVGLRHDPHSRRSIMHPGVANRVATLEPDDIAVLRSRYANIDGAGRD